MYKLVRWDSVSKVIRFKNREIEKEKFEFKPGKTRLKIDRASHPDCS